MMMVMFQKKIDSLSSLLLSLTFRVLVENLCKKMISSEANLL